jgi:hypothetical protein
MGEVLRIVPFGGCSFSPFHKKGSIKKKSIPWKIIPSLTRVLVLSAHPHLYKSYLPLPFGLYFPPFSP